MSLRKRKLWGWLAFSLGAGCLILTGFDAVAINFSTTALLPVVGLFLLVLGAYLLLISGMRSEV